MAKTRATKENEIKEFVRGLGGAKSVVFADVSKLKVNDTSALRRKAKGEQVGVATAKKTLLKIALKQAGVSAVDIASLPGSVSLFFGMADEVAPAKVVETFRKDHENVKILGGLLESKWMSAGDTTALAMLPSKQELIARVVGSISAPLSGMVNVLQGNLRNLVYVLNAIKDSKPA